MSIFWIILLILLAVFALFVVMFLFMDVVVDVNLKKPKGDKATLDATLTLPGGKVLYEKHYGKDNSSKNEENTQTPADYDESFKQQAKDFRDSLLAIKYTYSHMKHYLKKNVLMEKLRVNVAFATDDAFTTAMTSGAVWTGIFGVIAFLTTFITVTEPDIVVKPDFDEEQYIEADGECIIKLSVINLIRVVLALSGNYDKAKNKINNNEKAAINYGSKSN